MKSILRQIIREELKNRTDYSLKKATAKDLHLDKPTSHGGWPEGEYKIPVNKQLMDYFKSMGLVEQVDISPDLNSCNDKSETISSFINHCCQELSLNQKPSIKIASNREDDGIVTTAHYKPATGEIAVYAKGRALPDILRSIAHEMVHMGQHENGDLEKYPVQNVGGHIEDEANSRAGSLIKGFALRPENKHIYESTGKTLG